MKVTLKIALGCLVVWCSQTTFATESGAVDEECPEYSFGLTPFIEELSSASGKPSVPTGRFRMIEEKYFLSKIPQPVIFEELSSEKLVEVPITQNYCWYTELGEVFAQKGRFRHIFEMKEGKWVYSKTSYAYISLISVED